MPKETEAPDDFACSKLLPRAAVPHKTQK